MDLEKIEGLVKIIENSSLTEFTYKEGDLKIAMSKLDHPPIVAAGVPVAAQAEAPAAANCGGRTGHGRRRGKALYHFSDCGNFLFRARTGCTGLCQSG